MAYQLPFPMGIPAPAIRDACSHSPSQQQNRLIIIMPRATHSARLRSAPSARQIPFRLMMISGHAVRWHRDWFLTFSDASFYYREKRPTKFLLHRAFARRGIVAFYRQRSTTNNGDSTLPPVGRRHTVNVVERLAPGNALAATAVTTQGFAKCDGADGI